MNTLHTIKIKKPNNFSLNHIFDCGQCFRFNQNGSNSYNGVAYGHYIEITQLDDEVTIASTSKGGYEAIWKDYFDIDFDYSECINNFSFDNTLKIASSYASGIRILHQDHWEALCSFIISQNNNIPRIKKIIETMCEQYGEHVYTDNNNKKYYSFPSPKAIFDAGEEKIFELKTGFRAKYIIDAAKKVVSGEISFDEIESMPTEIALNKLCEIKGVGLKVASCVLLFSFRKYDCFPIDVWMKKILEKYYPDVKSKEYFGEYAGIAQQYLFYYERCMSGIEINKEK